MKEQTKILLFYAGDAPQGAPDRGGVTVTAAKLVLCSQYCDLRDEKGDLVATITWTGNMRVRELGYEPKQRAAR